MPALVDRSVALNDATDHGKTYPTDKVELLRPNQVCNKVLQNTLPRVARKDPAIQSPLPQDPSSPEPSQESKFPKSHTNLKETIKEEINSYLKDKTFINQLVVEPISKLDPLTESEVREIEIRTDPRCHKAYSLSHLKIGLHASVEGDPSWQYALVDGGCNNNLISLNALKHLADFNRANISQSLSDKIVCANNDASQVVEGRVKLFFSLIDSKGKRIALKTEFLIVSGLTHDVFVGTPLLNSPQVNHITRDAIFFNPIDCFKNPQAIFSKTSPHLQEVMLTHHLNARVKATKSKTVQPKCAQRIPINCVISSETDPDTLHYFQPSEKFHRKFPSLHVMQQTVLPSDNVSIFVINTSSRPVKLHRHTHLGTVKSVAKTEMIIEPIQNYVKADKVPEQTDPDLTQLNNVKIEQIHKDFELIPIPTTFCNHAFTSNMHDHPNTPEENEERKQDFKNLGYFQKTVSETLNDSKNIPSLEYTGKNQFKPKSDADLLSEINLTHLSPHHQALAKAMLERNITAFQRHPLDIGCCKGITAFAPLTTPNPPILYAKYVPIPLAYKEPAQKLIDEYCAAGVLAPTNKPCRFTSNIFIIPKKDGTFRLIFDGRILSKYCQQLPIALGNFDEIFSNLTDKSFVSKLDLSKAYDQLAVDDETSQLLSFFGPDARRYVYKRSGQGLKFSSFFLNQAMDSILFGMKDVHSYCDDIFITGDTNFEDHLEKLEQVIKRFQDHNVKLNIAKLEIAPETLDFLGLTWSRNKLSIPKSKITAYTNLKQPKSIKEARFLVNSLSFYRRFIPKFSDTIYPILELIKENEKTPKPKRKFNWTEKHQNAVDKLVTQIENGMSIYLPRKDRMFIIHTDASYVAAAATVSQVDDDGHTRLVAAVSRTFNTSERRTAPVHKEILSLLYCLTSLNYILRGHFLRVFADAKSLTLLKTCSTSSPYLSRLAMELSIYDFELFHLPGKLNIEADALSRMTKTQDKILSSDKQKGTAMTKEESLLFLEFLTIPVDHHITQTEIRNLLTSEPLRTELKAKVKSRLASAKKTKENNGPQTVKSKKTRQPKYVKSHPLEKVPPRNCALNSLTNFTTLASPPPPTSLSQSPPVISLTTNYPAINPAKVNTVILPPELYPSVSAATDQDTSTEFSDTESELSQSENEEQDFYEHSSLNDFACANLTCLIHGSPQEEISESRPLHACSPHDKHNGLVNVTTDIQPSHTDLLAILTDSDRHYLHDCASDKQSETPSGVPCDPTSAPCHVNEHAETNSSDTLCLSLSAFEHKALTPSVTFSLNNTVGVHNVKLSDSISELQTKSDILTTGKLTVDEFKSAQQLDKKIQELKDSLQEKRSLQFTERQGILCKKVNDKFLPILPQCLEKFLFNCEHFHVTAGHRSATAMIADLKTKFFIFNMKQKVLQFCKDCYICSIAKSQNMKSALSGTTKKAEFPKQIMSFDIFGGLPADDEGHRWVYTFIDNFSLFVINIKAKTKSTKEILGAFLQVFSIYSSIPDVVVSDNESGLMTKEALDFFASFSIAHNPGAAHAHWRLLAEPAAIKKTKSFLRAACKTDPSQLWPQALSLATIALNNTKTSHGFAPSEIFYGNTKRQKTLIESETKASNMDEYMTLVQKNFDSVLKQVFEARKQSTEHRAKLVNQHRAEKNFQENQLVWLKSIASATSPNRALKLKNLGPFRILRKINDHTFHLARLSNPSKSDRIAHASHLEAYRSQVDMTPINFPAIAWNLK